MTVLTTPGGAGCGPRCGERGFAHLRRFQEPGTGRTSVQLLPGEFYVSRQDEVVTTVLGSCVSACIHDPVARVGGMNHFMLPQPGADGGHWVGTAVGRLARYGSDAMERLVNGVLQAGGLRERLRIKIFGGGCVLAGMTDIGRRNIGFVRGYLAAEGLPLAAEDVGGVRPRRIRFYPQSGRTQVRRLGDAGDRSLADRERRYLKQLAIDPIQGGVELF